QPEKKFSFRFNECIEPRGFQDSENDSRMTRSACLGYHACERLSPVADIRHRGGGSDESAKKVFCLYTVSAALARL
ncbi:hypothetical protein QUG96_21065, partial [Klebsiella michiganensis]